MSLLAVGNTAPLVLRWIAGKDLFRPLDGGLVLPDGKPLFGRSKTWAGIFCSIAACAVTALLLSLPVRLGAYAGLAAMAGDLCASFVKRRLGILSSRPAPGLDQLPEALLPALVLRDYLALSWWDLGLVLVVFALGEMGIAAALQRFGLRESPF